MSARQEQNDLITCDHIRGRCIIRELRINVCLRIGQNGSGLVRFPLINPKRFMCRYHLLKDLCGGNEIAKSVRRLFRHTIIALDTPYVCALNSRNSYF